MRELLWKDYFDIADLYAQKISGCLKVQVGSAIVKDGHILSLGANRCIPNSCLLNGCLRMKKYGNDSKSHRDPSDCRAIHSEVDAIANLRESARGATIIVTRYPCEACARAIASAGIKEVWYGGSAETSEMTDSIFDSEGINVHYMPNWKQDDSDR